jgi:hypothetical protein
MMSPALLALAFGSTVFIAVADVPTYDVSPACRGPSRLRRCGEAMSPAHVESR